MKYNAFSKNSLSNAFTNQMNTFANRSQRENLTKKAHAKSVQNQYQNILYTTEIISFFDLFFFE